MSPPHKNLEPAQWLAVAGVCLLLMFGIRGCSKSKPALPPATHAQLLPGVWRSTQEGIDLIWSFSPDGGLRWQLQPHSAWLALIGGGFDVKGRWRLDGDQLTMELLETPPNLAIGGVNWTGKSQTTRITKLTNVELKLDGSDLDFRRSLAPPEK